MVAIFIPGERAPLEKMSFFDNQEFNFCSKDFFLTLLINIGQYRANRNNREVSKNRKTLYLCFHRHNPKGARGTPRKNKDRFQS